MNRAIINTLLIIGTLILANIIGSYFYGHLDLTEEKRFTLTKPTKNLLNNLEDVVLVQVLLDGEFPAGFKRLQNATKDILDDFRSESGYIEYSFENPNEGPQDEVNSRREILTEQGVVPINLHVKGNDISSKQQIYPYALLSYKNKTVPINLLEPEVPGTSPEVILNNSISLLEYKFSSAIDKLEQKFQQPKILFTSGHYELAPLQTRDFELTMQAFYRTGRINLDTIYKLTPDDAAVLVVAKPLIGFTEKQKFVLDQYVMNGGKVMWLLDKLNVNLDSLKGKKQYVPYDLPLNLDDQLFKYGARIQPNLVLDMQSSRIPQVIGQQGNNPQMELYPYFYHPVVVPQSDHPIVKSLEGINFYFPSSIDTIKTKTSVKKTVLLQSSQYSRLQYSPMRLDFEILKYKPDPKKFNKPFQAVALLLEGEFPSLYDGRVTDGMKEGLAQIGEQFQAKSKPTKMIVVSDGDIIKNLVDPTRKAFKPLGYNPYENYKFANKDFLINAIEYLMDDEGVIMARSKEVKLRLLNTVKAKEEKTKWQLINLILPLVFLALFGFFFTWLRKRKYAS